MTAGKNIWILAKTLGCRNNDNNMILPNIEHWYSRSNIIKMPLSFILKTHTHFNISNYKKISLFI